MRTIDAHVGVWTALAAVALVMCCAPPALAGVQYEVIDLGTLGGDWSDSRAINDSGQVVGTSWFPGNGTAHPYIYSAGTMTDLGTLGGSIGEGEGINNRGQVTGGASTTGNAAWDAFVYSGGTMTDISTLAGGSMGQSINNSGQVAGFIYLDSGPQHAFLYNGSTMSDLGTLGGTNSSAYSINNSGQVVGLADIASGATHAFIYSGGTMTDLGTLGGSMSEAHWINDRGQVVGMSLTAGDAARDAFLYTSSTGMVDVSNLIDPSSGWTLTSLNGINDLGQIVGYGVHNGIPKAFLLDPVPEPISLIFFGTGLVGVVGYVARRRNG